MRHLARRISAKNIYYIYYGAYMFLMAIITSITEIYYINVVNMTAFQLVIVGTVLEIADFIFEIPTGVFADTKGRKFAVVIGLIFTGVGFIVQGLFPVFLIIVVSQLLWSVGFTLISGADVAWLADEIGEDKVELVFIKGSQIAQILTIVGLFAGTALATLKLSLPIIISGILFIVIGFYLAIYMPETNFKQVDAAEINSFKKMFSSLKRAIKKISSSSVLIVIIAVAAFEGLYSEGFDRLWTMHFLNDIRFPNIGISYIMWFSVINSVAMIFSAIAMEVIKRKFEKEGKITMLWVLSLISIILMASIFVFALSSNFELALLSYWSCRIMRNLHDPVYTAWINQNIDEPALRATILSTKGQASAVGQIVGGPIVGAIATIFSVGIGIGLTGVLVLPLIVIYIYAMRKFKN